MNFDVSFCNRCGAKMVSRILRETDWMTIIFIKHRVYSQKKLNNAASSVNSE